MALYDRDRRSVVLARSRLATVRYVPILLVVGLLGGTAAAFAVTENLKLERSPILDTRVDKLFGPLCECERQRASIDFRLRKTDRVTLVIVDRKGHVVRTLVDSSPLRAGPHHFTWNGLDAQRLLVDDGIYQPRVHLAGEHRTILLPNRIHADTTSPEISLVSVTPRVISPDRDNRRDHIIAVYRVSEPARAILLVNGKERVRLRPFRTRGQVWWGKQVPQGRYRIQLEAEDLAGNVGPTTKAVTIRVRYIELSRHVIRTYAGGRFGVVASTDAKRYTWRLGRRHGALRGGRKLVLLMPNSGRYVLTVSTPGHSDRAVVIVK